MKQSQNDAPFTQLLLAVNYMTKRTDFAPMDAVDGPNAEALRLLDSVGLITIGNRTSQRITEKGVELLARFGLLAE